MNRETGGKMNVGYVLHTYNLIIFSARVQKRLFFIFYFHCTVVVTCSVQKSYCMFYSELPVAPDISSDDALDALEIEGLKNLPNFVLI